MAAYSLYDVLRTLVDRVGWPTEAEKRLCVESINEAEQMAIFGNLASIMTCDHVAPPSEEHLPYFTGVRTVGVNGKTCRKCGKIL